MNLVYINLVIVTLYKFDKYKVRTTLFCITSDRIWMKDNFIGGFAVN